MKRILLVVFFISLSILLVPAPAQAAEQVISRSDALITGSEDGVLCLPGVYFHDMGDCAPVGPSTYLTEMAEMGITLPLTPLPAKKPDFELTYVDVRYGQVRTSNAPVYPSVEAALKGNRKQAIRRIDAPFSYISYTDEVVIDGKRFYMIEPNAWMTANDVIRIGAVPLFQGMTY